MVKTKADLIQLISNYDDKKYSAYDILLDILPGIMRDDIYFMLDMTSMVHTCIERCMQNYVHVVNLCTERALWLEAYIGGKLYNIDSEEYLRHIDEYTSIQKGHASFIKDICNAVNTGKLSDILAKSSEVPYRGNDYE